MVARSESRYVMLAVADRLKRCHGSTIHLYCSTEQEVAFYRAQDKTGLFASIGICEILLNNCLVQGLDAADVIERARRYEMRTGNTYNELALANRHLGRGYALGGLYHPPSRQSRGTTYVQMLHAYNEALAYWESELREKGITVLLNGTKDASTAARMLGVPQRILAEARYKNYHYWAETEFLEYPEPERAYRRIETSPVVELDAPYLSHQVLRARFLRDGRFSALVRTAGLQAMMYAYWHLRGFEKAKGNYLHGTLRYLLKRWRDINWLKRHATATLADFKDKPFVFYPLHTEPETALQGLSPEYFYQLSAIAAVSRDLPAGFLLAVKETFAGIGRRPRDFYRQILEFKNVIILDPVERGIDIVREAAATVTITGTAGMEAAIIGKPVIAFGRHNVYNFLPHVMVVTEECQLKGYLHRAVVQGIDTERARLDGARFLQALCATSFDLGDYNYVNLRSFNDDDVDVAVESLVASVDTRRQTPSAKVPETSAIGAV